MTTPATEGTRAVEGIAVVVAIVAAAALVVAVMCLAMRSKARGGSGSGSGGKGGFSIAEAAFMATALLALVVQTGISAGMARGPPAVLTWGRPVGRAFRRGAGAVAGGARETFDGTTNASSTATAPTATATATATAPTPAVATAAPTPAVPFPILPPPPTTPAMTTTTTTTSPTLQTQQTQTQQTQDAGVAAAMNVPDLPGGYTVLLTSMDPRSYAGSGKTWHNLAPASSSSSSSSPAVADFFFSQTPSFSPQGGFALGDNVLTGPQSHELGLDGDLALSVAFVLQPTGEAPQQTAASAFQLFANTPDNNGYQMSFKRSASDAAATGAGLVSYDAYLQAGSAAPQLCEHRLVLDPRHRYLVVVTKDRAALNAVAVDLDAKAFVKDSLATGVPAPTTRVRLANVDMTVNGGGDWSANLLALLMYPYALVDTDVVALYAHFRARLRLYDPEYVRLQQLVQGAAAAKACPYDAATCGACGGVLDWSGAGADTVVTSGGPGCLRAIDRFCAADPTHPRCSCWDLSNPEYGRGCSAYRGLFAAPAAPEDGEHAQGLGGGSTSDQQQLSTLLSPNNVDAITRLITAVRGPAALPVPYPSTCGDGSCRTRRHQHKQQHPDGCGCARCVPRAYSAHEEGERDEDDERRDGDGDGDGDEPSPSSSSSRGFWSFLGL
jgi:hypothetical protein